MSTNELTRQRENPTANLDAYRAEMQRQSLVHDACLMTQGGTCTRRCELGTIELLRGLLTEWATAPYSYGAKKDLLERTRILTEGWQDVE